MGAVILMIIFFTGIEVVDFIWTLIEYIRKERRKMKYKYTKSYCSKCGKMTDWIYICPKGCWKCVNCERREISNGRKD